MFDAERIGSGIVQRLIGRLSKLRVSVPRDESEPTITGTMGALYERQAEWQRIHGEPADVARWTQPERFRRFLETGTCDCHPDGPQQH